MPIQTTNIFDYEAEDPTGLGLVYAGPGIKWTVAKDVFVGASKVAVYSEHNGSKLINKGEISSDRTGVHFEAKENGTVINKAGASIFGTYGVTVGTLASKNMKVVNHGEIFGHQSHGVMAADVSNFYLHNTGEIFGRQGGVHTLAGSPAMSVGATIINDGTIRSDVYGIYAQAIPGLVTTIVNGKHGTIAGAEFAIRCTPGQLSLENRGKIKGVVYSADLDDVVVNHGRIKGEVVLNGGDDTFRSKGGKAGIVHGGDGNDTLLAGSSKDVFAFDTALEAQSNVDRIKHFDPGKDKLALDQGVFAALDGGKKLSAAMFHEGKQAADADDHIIYDKATGRLFYDADGSGDGAQIEFARLDKGQKLHSGDFLVFT